MGVNHNGWIDGSTTTSASCCHFNLKTEYPYFTSAGWNIQPFFFFIFQFRVTGALEPIPLGEVCGTPWTCCQIIPHLLDCCRKKEWIPRMQDYTNFFIKSLLVGPLNCSI